MGQLLRGAGRDEGGAVVKWGTLAILMFGICVATVDADKQADAGADAEGGADAKVIYGADDRIDVFQETDSQRLMYAASTCGLISNGDLQENLDGTFTVSTSPLRGGGTCPDEPFRDQGTAPFCTGFVVGPDLIVTAGHCMNGDAPSDLDGFKFVFGYEMVNPNTLNTTFDANQVYEGVEVVARELNNNTLSDYAVVRVDRAITAPGAQPLPIRRGGKIGLDEAVGVIGHPSGLPKKIAFGSETLVRNNDNQLFFGANLDTYGGNSGSPVFNQETGVVEGILVRGQTDYIVDGGCERSNMLPNTNEDVEDVTRTTVFDQFVDELGTAQFQLERNAVSCNSTLDVRVNDPNFQGQGTIMITVTSSTGDEETVTLTEANGAGNYDATLTFATGTASDNDGTVQVADGGTVTLAYDDPSNDDGQPETIETMVDVDCTDPVIQNVSVDDVGGSTVQVSFATSELAVPMVQVGTTCGTYTNSGSAVLGTNHTVTVSGLMPNTSYVFSAVATDPAGNSVTDMNNGSCYSFTTGDVMDRFTEVFSSGFDLTGKSLTLVPDNGAYTACLEDVADYWTNPECGTELLLHDDDFATVTLSPGNTFPFFGQNYSQLHVGSNGYITFGQGDTAHDGGLTTHFGLPRISPFFTDLNPFGGGLVSVAELEDRVVVSWDDVPHFDTIATSGFQVELFFDGGIRIVWESAAVSTALVGLSDGQGVPANFQDSDVSSYPTCASSLYPAGECQGPGIICAAAPGQGASGMGSLVGDMLLLVLAATALAVPRWARMRPQR